MSSRTKPTKRRVSAKCILFVTLGLNVAILCMLSPMYRRLLEAKSKRLEGLRGHNMLVSRESSVLSVPAEGESGTVAAAQMRKYEARRKEMMMRQQRENISPASPVETFDEDILRRIMMRPQRKNMLRQPFLRRRPNYMTIPFVSEDEFQQKYAAKYHGLLPSLNREKPDDVCGVSPDFFHFFQLPKTERSRFSEDYIIYGLFKNNTLPRHGETLPLPRGAYVELGAFDGRDESNTMFFDRCLGWKGLLIEAQAQSYQQVIEHRPHAIKMSFSPTCHDEGGTAKVYDYPLSNNGMEGLAKSYTGKETVDIPCGPLTPVLQDVFGDDGIAFFSLDVEGAELLVLETIDFEVVNIEVLMIEIQNSYCPEADCPNVHAIRQHMAETGKYALFVNFLEASDVYVLLGSEAHGRAKQIEWDRETKLKFDIQKKMMEDRKQIVG